MWICDMAWWTLHLNLSHVIIHPNSTLRRWYFIMGQVQFWSLPRISSPSLTTSLSWTQDVSGRGHWNWRSCFSDPSDGGDSYEISWRHHQYSELCLYAFWPQRFERFVKYPDIVGETCERLFVLILVLTKSGSMYWFSDLAKNFSRLPPSH